MTSPRQSPPGNHRHAGTGLDLRDVTEDDLPVFFAHQQDPEAFRMAAFPPRDRDVFMTHWGKVLRNDTVTAKAVVLDGRVVGNVLCWKSSGRHEIGYWIAREHWGKGIATRAVFELLKIVPARPLEARVAHHNRASLRVLEKCGFEIVGRTRARSHDPGEEVDQLILELR